MPILAYCIIDANAGIEIPHAGIAGSEIQVVEHAGLQCLISQLDSTQAAGLSGREVALAFHRVLQAVFRQAAIIPFRFPTTVEDQPELFGFLDEHAGECRESLVRLRDMVQMEILVTWRVRDRVISPGQQTGSEYLRQKVERHGRLMAVAESVRSELNTIKADWRERGSADGVRLFALVARSAVGQFEAQLAGLKIDPELVARVSGPWPATEFLPRDNARP